MNENNWPRLLTEWFGSENVATTDSDWERLKQSLSVGQRVTGTVVAKSPFGAWLDVAGFPALLQITCIEGLTPERYAAGDWCAIGTQVSALVGGFLDSEHQIALYQVKPGESME